LEVKDPVIAKLELQLITRILTSIKPTKKHTKKNNIELTMENEFNFDDLRSEFTLDQETIKFAMMSQTLPNLADDDTSTNCFVPQSMPHKLIGLLGVKKPREPII
jgi:hypothetical protein